MVGACAALAFARQGRQVVLLERQPANNSFDCAASVDLRVSAISPASQRFLSSLGAWPPLCPGRHCDYQHMRVWHEHGTSELVFRAEQVAASHLGTIVENSHLLATLLDRIAQHPNVDQLFGTDVATIEQNDSGVMVSTGLGETIRAELLIAADGRDSGIAKMLSMAVTGGDYGQRAIVAYVETSDPHQHTAWQRFLATGPLAFLPLWDGRSSIVWSAHDALADELLSLNDEAFAWQLQQAFDSRLGEVVSCSQRASFPLSWHYAERWLEGRVLLIGDAAHGVHPLAGQGVNLGFADVELLHSKLANRENLYRQVDLRRFERQRKAESVTAMHLFTALNLIYQIEQPLFCKARDLGMATIENQADLKSLIMRYALQNMA